MAPKNYFSNKLSLITGLICFLSCAVCMIEAKKPNILFVLLDDLGWNDVGYRNDEFDTPNIDEMYNKAIRFTNSYATPNCGPSRAALLSGCYPFRFGVQGNAINSRSASAVPTNKKFISTALKNVGYKTHLIGKWHQGFCKKSQLPNSRGFDTFFGFYLTKQDHFTHIGKKDYFDFRNNTEVDRSVEGKYSTYLFSETAKKRIADHKASGDKNPFYILLSYAAIHGPNQVPQEYISKTKCKDVKGDDRQLKCGMMAAVDEGLKNITQELKDQGMLDDTLIVFTSDDGGKVEDGSSNWPLRGSKRTMWEGGIKVNTFMYSESSSVLPEQNFDYNGMFYITDFYATLLGMAEDNTKSKKFKGVLDSFNQWKFIKNGDAKGSYRKNIVHFDENTETAYIRDKQYKLLINQSRDSGWYNPPKGVDEVEEPDDRSLPAVQMFNIQTDPNEQTDLNLWVAKQKARMEKDPAKVNANSKKKMERFEKRVNDLTKKLMKMQPLSKSPFYKKLESSPRHFNDVWSTGWCNNKAITSEDSDSTNEESGSDSPAEIVA